MSLTINTNIVNLPNGTITNLCINTITSSNLANLGIATLTISNLKVTSLSTLTSNTIITSASLNVTGSSILQGLTSTTLTATGVTSVSSLNVAATSRLQGLTVTHIGVTGDALTASTTVSSLRVTNNITAGGSLTGTLFNASAPIYHTSTASGTQTFSATSPATSVIFASNILTNGITFNSGTGVSTIVVPGWYGINSTVATSFLSGHKAMGIVKNSATELANYYILDNITGIVNLSVVANLAASDTIHISVYTNGAAQSITTDANLAIIKLF